MNSLDLMLVQDNTSVLSEKEQLRLANIKEAVRYLATRSDLCLSVQETLIAQNDANTLLVFAANKHILKPVQLLFVKSHFDYVYIMRALASNVSISPEVIAELAKHPDEIVLDRLIDNSSFSPDVNLPAVFFYRRLLFFYKWFVALLDDYQVDETLFNSLLASWSGSLKELLVAASIL